jgi:glycosyltransferase involved in cell wall biosynthesis
LFVDALTGLGTVDFLAYSDLWRGYPDVGDPRSSFGEQHGISRLESVLYPDNKASRLRRVLSAIVGDEAARILIARRAFAGIHNRMTRETHYDLVVYIREMSWFIAGKNNRQPSLVDIDDFSDVVLRRWLDLGLDESGAELTTHRRLQLLRRIRATRRRRAHLLKQPVGKVVVSEIDARRVGIPGIHIVPNAVPKTVSGNARLATPRRNILVFVGLHVYAPNKDGALWFINEVLPHVIPVVPDVEFHIVGRADDSLLAYNAHPNITVTGAVADVAAVLQMSKGAVIPLRVGGGSRIKILEAMASSLPVVSTAVGAEGLGCTPERNILIADEAESFARACVRVLQGGKDVHRLAEEGRVLAVDQYSPASVVRFIKAVVRKELGR